MTSVRQRKGSRGKESQPAAEPHAQPTICCSDHPPESSSFLGDWSWKAIIWAALGLSVSVGLGLLCCIYVATLHENDLWFSNIKYKSTPEAPDPHSPESTGFRSGDSGGGHWSPVTSLSWSRNQCEM